MFDEENRHDFPDTDDVLLRLDYLEIRMRHNIDSLEHRIKQLEENSRRLNDSGESDFLRFKNLLRNITQGSKIEKTADTERETFFIKANWTTTAAFWLCVLASVAESNKYSRSGAETFGFFIAIYIQIAGIPALIAFLIAGRHKQYSRRDRWYFWCTLVAAAVLFIKFVND